MFVSLLAICHTSFKSNPFKWVFYAFAAALIAAVMFFPNPAHAQCSACEGLSGSAKAGGTSSITSSSGVNLSGIGSAYSQATGVGSIKATATSTPGNPLGAKVTSSASVDGVTFTVGNGNYSGLSTFDGKSTAGGKARAEYSVDGIYLSGNVTSDSGYFKKANGATVNLASSNGQGSAGGASTKATASATASATKSLAECVTDLLGKGDTDIFSEAAGYGNGVIVDGVLLAPGAGYATANSKTKATVEVKVE